MFVQNLPALLTLFGTVVMMTMGAILLLGFLPLNTDKSDRHSVALTLMVFVTGAAIAACTIAAVIWCLRTLPISWSIIAAGLGLLTGPLLFQILPHPIRDRPIGLICTTGVSIALGFFLLGANPV